MSLLLFLSFFCSSPTPARNEEEEMLLLDLLSFRFAPVLRPELSAAFEEQFGKHLVGGFDFDDDDEEEDDEEDAKEESTWAAE